MVLTEREKRLRAERTRCSRIIHTLITVRSDSTGHGDFQGLQQVAAIAEVLENGATGHRVVVTSCENFGDLLPSARLVRLNERRNMSRKVCDVSKLHKVLHSNTCILFCVIARQVHREDSVAFV